MSENRKLASNVAKFLFDAAESFGRIKTDEFSQDMFCQLIENGIESPIEDLFFIERAYEKSRDRFLVKAGYRVLHFTGSEVVSDPYKVAFEVLSLIGMSTVSGIDEYDPLNPLGIE